MSKHPIMESFNWLTPEAFTYTNVGKNKVRIKGIALKSGSVSRNMRHYIDEELVKSARTLVNRPINVNHNSNQIVGNVEFAEYEDGNLEYYGIVSKQPYVDYIRNRDPAVKGVSVQAKYLYNHCPECKQRFLNESEFAEHMKSAHQIHNFQWEPRGIVYDALALVVSPEVPGVGSTTVELMETAGMSRLMETLTTDVKSELDMKDKLKRKATLTSESRITIDKAKHLKEQDEEPPQEPCAEGEERDPTTGECKPTQSEATEQDQTQQTPPPEPTVEAPTPCAEGFEDDGAGGCKPIEWPAIEPPEAAPVTSDVTITIPKVDAPPIPAPAAITGPIIEQDTGTDTPPMEAFPTTPPSTPTPTCSDGSHVDPDTNECVPDTPTPLEVTDFMKEFKLPRLLTLGEPFADYADFDDCVAKNKGKADDPEAYCADIKRKVEGETVSETLHKDFPLISAIDRKHTIGTIRNAQAINQLNRTVANIGKGVSAIPTAYTKPILTEARLRAKGDKVIVGHVNQLSQTVANAIAQSHNRLAEYIQKVVPATDQHSTKLIMEYTQQLVTATNQQTMKAILEYQQQTTQHLARSFATLVRGLTECSRKSDAALASHSRKGFTKVDTDMAKINEKIDQWYTDFHKVLDVADKNAEERDTRIKTLETRLQEQEDAAKEKCPDGQHRDEEGKCVPDKEPEQVTELKKELEGLKETVTTLTENRKAELRGQFKGHDKKIDEPSKADYANPEKELRDTARKRT